MSNGLPAYPHARASLAATLASNPSVLANIRAVLVRPSLPANIGAAARALMTMGLTRLVLVAPECFPHADAASLASGATGILDAVRVVGSLEDALRETRLSIGFSARPRHFAGRVAVLRDVAREAVAAAARSEVALVFGTEMSGLSNDELSQCTVAASIPGNPVYPSLNLAAAVQVAAWEIRSAAVAAGEPLPVAPAPRRREFEPASHDDIEALHRHARRTLAMLGVLDPQRPRRLLPRLRRLFGRAGLEHEEVNLLRGILARIDTRCEDGRSARREDEPDAAREHGREDPTR